jgi:hypothetical protein
MFEVYMVREEAIQKLQEREAGSNDHLQDVVRGIC